MFGRGVSVVPPLLLVFEALSFFLALRPGMVLVSAGGGYVRESWAAALPFL